MVAFTPESAKAAKKEKERVQGTGKQKTRSVGPEKRFWRISLFSNNLYQLFQFQDHVMTKNVCKVLNPIYATEWLL